MFPQRSRWYTNQTDCVILAPPQRICIICNIIITYVISYSAEMSIVEEKLSYRRLIIYKFLSLPLRYKQNRNNREFNYRANVVRHKYDESKIGFLFLPLYIHFCNNAHVITHESRCQCVYFYLI